MGAGLTDVGMLVGTLFSNVLSKTLGAGQVDFQGVSYNAGVGGYLIGGDPAGAKAMAKMVSQTASKCPNTKIVIGGYR
jgi:cutinase